MALTYDRRSFWIQVILAFVFSAVFYFSQFFLDRGNWRAIFWLDTPAFFLIPFCGFNMLMAVISPTLCLRKEAKRSAQGLPVAITSKQKEFREKHWISPVPVSAWATIASFILLIFIIGTDLIPRIAFGYRGTIGQNTYVAWRQESSPDGNWIAMDASPLDHDRSRTLSMVERKTGKTTHYPWDEHQGKMSWSQDSRYVAFGSEKILRVLNPAQGQAEIVGLPSPSAFRFHPDGTLWILCDTGLWSWTPLTKNAKCLLNSKELNLCIKGCDHEPSTMALSPDGGMIALRYNEQVRVLETAQFQEIAKWAVPENLTYNNNMRFLAGKKLLMSFMGPGKAENTLLIFDAITGAIRTRIEGVGFSSYPLEDVDFSSDGRWMVAMRQDRCVAVWSFANNRWIWSAPYPSNVGDRCPRFSTDSREITTLCFTERFLFKSLGRCIRRWHWKVPENV